MKVFYESQSFEQSGATKVMETFVCVQRLKARDMAYHIPVDSAECMWQSFM